MTITVVVTPAMSYDGNQHTYTDDSDPNTGMDGGGHVDRMVALVKDTVAIADYTNNTANSAIADVEAAAASALGGATTNSTSATLLAIGTGSKTFTLTETGKAYVIGQYVIAASIANPTTKNMIGQVTTFSGVSLTIDSSKITGDTLTAADWSISVTAQPFSGNAAPDFLLINAGII